MTKWVIDASVAIKWFLAGEADEMDTDKALLLLDFAVGGRVSFLQPPHWIGEVAGVLARRNPATAADNIEDMLLFEFCTIAGHAHIYRRAITLSQELNHHLLDTLYHAVALEEEAMLITADRHYYAKAAPFGGIAMLKDWAAP